MKGEGTAVFGLYNSTAQAEDALDHLTAARLSSDEVSMLMLSMPGTKRAGAGGTLGLLAGLTVVATRESGSLLAAGSILSVLANLEQSGQGISCISAGLAAGLGITTRVAERIMARINQGGVLLSVRCDTPRSAERALEVLGRAGPEEVGSGL